MIFDPYAQSDELAPTPEEIAIATAEIRSTWTAAEFTHRQRVRPRLPIRVDSRAVEQAARSALDGKLAKLRGEVA